MPDIRYSYKNVPTIKAFAQSDAFIRALIGPFGCLPDDTEFLTPNGWKRMDAYQPGDLVAQWHQDGGADFVAPVHHDYPAPDGFLQFESGSLTMRLSADHRVPHYDWDGKFQVHTAARIAAKISRRKIPTTFDLQRPGRLDLSDDMIRFAVMMHADGHYPAQGRQAYVTVRKTRKKERIRYLLCVLGIEFSESVSPKRPTETVFRFKPPYRGKRFSGVWWSADRRQLAIILDEIQHWDGLFGYEEQRYFSAFREDADFIQYAAHALGRRATITVKAYPDKPHWKPTHIVAVKGTASLKNVATLRAEARVTKVPSADGRQYCFTVPSGFFIARCDDSIFVTGNSGKSSGCVVEIPRRGQMQKPGPDGIRRSRIAVVRNTFGQLEDTTIRTVHEWMPPAYFGRYYVSDHRYMIRTFANCEIEVLFRALDRPDHVKNLLSLDLTWAWLNEVREIPWAIVEAMQGRVGRFPKMSDGGATWSGVCMDTNPPDTDSKFYKFFEERDWLPHFKALKESGALPASVTKPEQYAAIFHQPSGLSDAAENRENLPAGYYQRMQIGKKDEWIKVYVKGDYGFVTDDKAVFPEYSDVIHRKEVNPVKGVAIRRGWDFGLCYDDQTEVLTFDGWKLFADVDCATDLIATRDPKTGQMEYAQAAFRIAQPYKGDMLEWASTELNICVTPEHRVPFTYRDSPGKVHWQSAEWLAQHMSGHHYVDLVSEWTPPRPLDQYFAGMEPMVFAEFMGIYLSEGSTEKNRITIYQASQRADFQRILDATGLAWKWFKHGKTSGWRVHAKLLATYLKPFGTARVKRVPVDLRFFPPAHIRAFIATYTLGDGHVRTRKSGAVEHTLYTSSFRMAGDMQDIAQKAGWNSSCRFVQPQASSLGKRTIQSGGGYSLTFKKAATRAELLKANFRRVPYDGTVYCLNVPHHTLYVRRKGKPSWNGNTPACTFSQLLPDGRWLVFDEMVSESMGIDRFSDDVLEKCTRAFRGPVEFEDYGDPAGQQRAQTDEKTCFEILQGKNVAIEPGKQTISLRLESIRRPLTRLIGGEPQFVLHPRCRVLRKAFLGGYYFRRMTTNAERYSDKPEKNWASHPMDALQYDASMLFGDALTGTPPRDDYPMMPPSEQGRSDVTGY